MREFLRRVGKRERVLERIRRPASAEISLGRDLHVGGLLARRHAAGGEMRSAALLPIQPGDGVGGRLMGASDAQRDEYCCASTGLRERDHVVYLRARKAMLKVRISTPGFRYPNPAFEMWLNESPIRIESTGATDNSREERNSRRNPSSRSALASTTPGAKPGLNCKDPVSGISAAIPEYRYAPPLELVRTPATGLRTVHRQGPATCTSMASACGISLRIPS